MQDSSNTWFTRFTMVSIFNALLALAWTVPVLLGGEFGLPNYDIAKTIAGGSVGTWGTVGYIIWLVVGIGIFFLSGIAYYIIPKVKGGTVYNNMLGFAHLVLMEIGTLGASVLLAWTGYVGGTMLLNKDSISSIHEAIVNYVAPIEIFIFIGILGGLAGIVNLAMTLRAKKTISK